MQIPKSVQVFVAFLAAVLSITQLWDWFAKPTQQLEAEVQFGPVLLPPSLAYQFEKLQPIVAGDWIEPLIHSSFARHGPAPKGADRLAQEITRELRYKLLDNVPTSVPSDVTNLSGYWRATVRNMGSQPLQGVRLVLPYTTVVRVEREGAPSAARSIDSVIELDVVHPRDVVRVTGWSEVEPSLANENSIRITHANGVGTVIINRPVGMIGRFADQYFPVLLISLPLLLLILLQARSYSRSVSSRKPPEELPKTNESSKEGDG